MLRIKSQRSSKVLKGCLNSEYINKAYYKLYSVHLMFITLLFCISDYMTVQCKEGWGNGSRVLNNRGRWRRGGLLKQNLEINLKI